MACGISGFIAGRGGGGLYATGLAGCSSPRYAANFEFAVDLAEFAAASALARSSAKEGMGRRRGRCDAMRCAGLRCDGVYKFMGAGAGREIDRNRGGMSFVK